ncbi:MAG: PadR family transcriptional regulator [Flammeovirgaceae bacterium]
MYDKELLKGTLRTIIMKLLSENGKMYGYEITQKVKEMSDGKILLKEGSLYPALHKLEAEGILEVEEVHIGKRVRRYYKLTPKGSEQTALQLNELVSFLETIHQLIVPQPQDTLNHGIA